MGKIQGIYFRCDLRGKMRSQQYEGDRKKRHSATHIGNQSQVKLKEVTLRKASDRLLVLGAALVAR